jgi:hypothetical protein
VGGGGEGGGFKTGVLEMGCEDSVHSTFDSFRGQTWISRISNPYPRIGFGELVCKFPLWAYPRIK